MLPQEQAKPNSMEDRIGQNMSILNPTDRAMMKQAGTVTSQTSIRDYFGMLGIDVDGPMEQLKGVMADQIGKADPAEKMQRIAGPGMGQPASNPAGAPAPEGDLKSLLSM